MQKSMKRQILIVILYIRHKIRTNSDAFPFYGEIIKNCWKYENEIITETKASYLLAIKASLLYIELREWTRDSMSKLIVG